MSRFDRQMKRRAQQNAPTREADRQSPPSRDQGRPTSKSIERRVVLQPPAGTLESQRGEQGHWWGVVANARAEGAQNQQTRHWIDQVHRYDGAKTHPVVRLTEHGPDYGVEPQPGDEIGYCMDPYRGDDCFQAAIATATQVPIEQVPDLALDKHHRNGEDPGELSLRSWQRIDSWASKRGLEMQFHWTVPVDRHRWVGVVMFRGAKGPGEAFLDHCLAMSHDRLVFDPSCSVRAPNGMRVLTFDPTRISYGISFDPKEE